MAKRSKRKKADSKIDSATMLERVISVSWIPLLLTVIVFAVYLPSLKSDFVSDARLEIDEGFVTSLSNLPTLFSPTVLGLNLMLSDRPGEMFYLMLNSALWGAKPFGYHLDSILLHAANVALLFVLLHRLIAVEAVGWVAGNIVKAKWAAAAATLIFALHPMMTESVAEVSFSSNLLVTFFSLVALLVTMAFRPDGSKASGVLGAVALVCVVGAVLCKESGIAVAALMIVYWFLYRRTEPKAPWLILLGAAVVVTVAVVATILHFGITRQLKQEYLGGSFSQVFVVQPQLWVYMLGQLFWPASLSADYVLEDMNLPSPAAAFFILIVVILLQAWLARKSRMGALGVAMWWIGLSTVSNLVPLYCVLADRFYYMPLAGLAMQLTALLLMTLRTKWGYEAAMACSVIALMPLTALTVQRQAVFANDLALGADTLQKSPHSTLMQNSMALAYFRQGQLDEAMEHYQRALEIEPTNSCALISMGMIHLRQGNPEDAIALFRKALEIDPEDDDAHCSLGIALCRTGHIDEGIDQLSQAVGIDPTNITARASLGMAFAQQGRIDEAIAQFQAALVKSPSSSELHANLGHAYAGQGQLDKAIEQYRAALEQNPDDLEVLVNLGVALAHKGQFEEAIVQDRKALAIRPDSPDLHDNLGVALIQKGEMDAGIGEFKEALRLNPNFTAAQNNLERAKAASQEKKTNAVPEGLEPILPKDVKTD
jgi:tetratricopeptide (TPR) repeat protein